MIQANKEVIAWCELAGFTSLAELLKEKLAVGQMQTFCEYEVWLIDEFRKLQKMSTLTEYVNPIKEGIA
jgi:hypothetical protein